MTYRWQSRRKRYGKSFGQNAGRSTFRSHTSLKRSAGVAKQNRRVVRSAKMVKQRTPQRYRPAAKHPWKQPKVKRFKRRV
jgi:hypothetical protein